MSSPLADSATAVASHPQMQRHARRTPEAQADIAAAHAAPTAMEVAMQEVDRAAEQAVHELRNAPTAFRSPLAPDATAADLDAALSNAALADTPAVREMGGTAPEQAMFGMLRRELAHVLGVDRDTDWQALLTMVSASALTPPGAVVITGPEAERYRAIAAAARKAQASTAIARADGAALLQLFQAFCAGLAPGKDG